jgi:hypothetical protein
MAKPSELVAALATYREARRAFLATAQRPDSNRDPVVEWAEALVEKVTGGRRVDGPVQAGYDVVDPLGRRIEVRTLRNSPGIPWVNEHSVAVAPDRDLYALVVFIDLTALGILLIDLGCLAQLGVALHKRHGDLDHRLELTAANMKTMLDGPSRFASIGLTVYRPPAWMPEPEPR